MHPPHVCVQVPGLVIENCSEYIQSSRNATKELTLLGADMRTHAGVGVGAGMHGSGGSGGGGGARDEDTQDSR